MHLNKILMIISSSMRGGAQRHVLDLVNCLSKMQYEVVVACPNGYLYNQIRQMQKVSIYKISSSAISIPQLFKIVVIEKPDIVHLHLLGAGVYGSIACVIGGVRNILYTVQNIVLYPRMSFWKRCIYPLLHKFASFMAKMVICVSEDIKEYFVGTLGVSCNKVIVVHNGIDVNLLESHFYNGTVRIPDTYNDKFLIGSVGRLSHQKGYLCLLVAVRHLLERYNDFRLILVGEGEMRSEIERYISEHSLGDYVFLAGETSFVGAWLMKFDVAVFPSIYEGLPIAHTEAASMGLPVIATNVGGTCEVIKDGISGIVVPPNSPVELAKAIELLYLDRSFAAELGCRAREFVNLEFTIQKCAQQIIESYLYVNLCK